MKIHVFLPCCFAQPSLPRRLRFGRQHSDLTPKRSKNAPPAEKLPAKASPVVDKEKKDKEALDAANVEIKNKTEVLLGYEQLIDELKQKSHELNQSNAEKTEQINEKDTRIVELERELADSGKANELLNTISELAIVKIDTLEGEIKMILRNHDNEIDFLIRTNADLELRYDQLVMQNKASTTIKELNELKTEMDAYMLELNSCKWKLQAETEKSIQKDLEYKKLLDENLRLIEGMDEMKQHADDDMLAYALESQKLLKELDTEKREKTKIINELCLKEELLVAMQNELADKETDMDAERDQLKENYNAEVALVSRRFEQHMATLKEMNEMQLKEAESVYVLERAKMVQEHNAALKSLKESSQKEIDRLNDLTEERIRISQIQSEQKFKGLETTIEQSLQHEKDAWKVEFEKCQKIAETEIIQCEFEKQDLKTLLQSANELISQKDEKIEDLEQRLDQEIENAARNTELYENEIKESKLECNRALTDRYNYEVTLKNTRSTVNILMERLKKSDSDVEILQMELDSMLAVKASLETQNLDLSDEVQRLRLELDEYRLALSALRNSSLALEKEVLEKESVFEKLMLSEEETLETVNKIGKLFNERLEENIGKYAELYSDLKKKYDARETYIKDMKALLEEFATGIELARLELDIKEKQIFELQEENKNIKLETMTYKFKCEQYDMEQRVPNPSPDFTMEEENGKPTSNEDVMVSNQLIENIINQLEKEATNQTTLTTINTELYSDEDKISAENIQLRERLTEQMKQIEFLQEMVDLENCHAKENLELKHKVSLLCTTACEELTTIFSLFCSSKKSRSNWIKWNSSLTIPLTNTQPCLNTITACSNWTRSKTKTND